MFITRPPTLIWPFGLNLSQKYFAFVDLVEKILQCKIMLCIYFELFRLYKIYLFSLHIIFSNSSCGEQKISTDLIFNENYTSNFLFKIRL